MSGAAERSTAVANFIVGAINNDPWVKARLEAAGWVGGTFIVPGDGAFAAAISDIAPECGAQAVVVMPDGDDHVRLVWVRIEAVDAPARLSEEGPKS